MVSDQEIAKGVETLLRQSDPYTLTTFNGVVQQLEANLGLDLAHKHLFIRDQINLLLGPPQQQQPQQQQQPPPSTQPIQPIPHPVQHKDHFALQNQPYFPAAHPQFHPHFALQQQQQQQKHHHHHLQQLQQQQQRQRPQELDFRIPQPQVKAQPPPPVAVKPEAAAAANVESASTASVAGNSSESPKESAPAAPKRRGGPGGLNKVCGVSPELQAVLGEPALPRTEIVKQLWAYIRKHNLQDPNNKRKIICDDALRVVFETDCTDMFKMNKLLSKHIIRLEPTKETPQAKRMKVKAEAAAAAAAAATVGSSESGPPPVIISEALSNFLGTGEREMLQSEVLGRVWEYIKVNHLEDPLHPMVIMCDAKLKDLLGCESISTMGISEMLARHHLFKR